MRPLIIKNNWWRFWRFPLKGLNPWRWDEVAKMEMEDGLELYLDGIHYPSEDVAGKFVLRQGN